MQLIHGDALTELKKMPESYVDLIATDPPYPVISGGSVTKNCPTGILKKNDGKIFEHNNIKASDWFPEVYRVLKPDSHCYIMTNVLNLASYLELAKEVGFKLHNLLVWQKSNCTPSQWYMKNCEYVLFLRKGKAKYVNNCGSKTVHTFAKDRDKYHPTQKPIALMELYVSNSSNESDIVLDPFMGSGTTGVACQNLKRYFIGIEIDGNFFKVSVNRINAFVTSKG